jgi:ribonuclease-3
MKSKIVKQKNLNKLGEEKLKPLLQADTSQTVLSENISGNLFEALIGAIYLDIDYEFCKKLFWTGFSHLLPSISWKTRFSYKGLLLEWSQKKKSYQVRNL